MHELIHTQKHTPPVTSGRQHFALNDGTDPDPQQLLPQCGCNPVTDRSSMILSRVDVTIHCYRPHCGGTDAIPPLHIVELPAQVSWQWGRAFGSSGWERRGQGQEVGWREWSSAAKSHGGSCPCFSLTSSPWISDSKGVYMGLRRPIDNQAAYQKASKNNFYLPLAGYPIVPHHSVARSKRSIGRLHAIE